MNHLNDLDDEELLSAHAQLSGKLMQRYLSEEEQTQLREMQEELLRRMTAADESHCRMGVACPMHDGQVHGQEASELRTKLEKYINRIDVIENGSDVTKELQHILDSTDARDSLAFEEQLYNCSIQGCVHEANPKTKVCRKHSTPPRCSVPDCYEEPCGDRQYCGEHLPMMNGEPC